MIFLHLTKWSWFFSSFFSVNMAKYIDWFLSVKSTLHSWNKYYWLLSILWFIYQYIQFGIIWWDLWMCDHDRKQYVLSHLVFLSRFDDFLKYAVACSFLSYSLKDYLRLIFSWSIWRNWAQNYLGLKGLCVRIYVC